MVCLAPLLQPLLTADTPFNPNHKTRHNSTKKRTNQTGEHKFKSLHENLPVLLSLRVPWLQGQ